MPHTRDLAQVQYSSGWFVEKFVVGVNGTEVHSFSTYVVDGTKEEQILVGAFRLGVTKTTSFWSGVLKSVTLTVNGHPVGETEAAATNLPETPLSEEAALARQGLQETIAAMRAAGEPQASSQSKAFTGNDMAYLICLPLAVGGCIFGMSEVADGNEGMLSMVAGSGLALVHILHHFATR